MTRRRLSQDELDLWRKVAAGTDRLRPEKQEKTAPDPKFVPATRPPLPPLRRPEPPKSPAVTYDLADPLSTRLATAPVRMDPKAFKRMRRGKLTPEARIDLHGMTVSRAQPTLNRFILASAAAGKRLVLVITGKGRDRDDGGPIPTPHGVLRHQVPHWLTIPPLAQHVIQFSPAHRSHGGEGAYYVYLRRPR